MEATSMLLPAGASSTAARSSAALKEARRKLPEIPSIFAMARRTPFPKQRYGRLDVPDYAPGRMGLRDAPPSVTLALAARKSGEHDVASGLDHGHCGNERSAGRRPGSRAHQWLAADEH